VDLAHHFNIPQQAVSTILRSKSWRVRGGIQQVQALQATRVFIALTRALIIEAFLRPLLIIGYCAGASLLHILSRKSRHKRKLERQLDYRQLALSGDYGNSGKFRDQQP
jgi:hypothetical protein